MTNAEKVSYILNKYSETKFDRAEFFWKYIQEFIVSWAVTNPKDTKPLEELFFITKLQFKDFWRDFAGIERELRNQLKNQLPKEQDSLRYKKAEEFRKEYQTPPKLKE